MERAMAANVRTGTCPHCGHRVVTSAAGQRPGYPRPRTQRARDAAPPTRHVAATAWGLLVAVVLLVSLFTALLTAAFSPSPGYSDVSADAPVVAQPGL